MLVNLEAWRNPLSQKYCISLCVYAGVCFLWASRVAQTARNLLALQETWVRSLGRDPWRRDWLPASVFLPGEFHGLRSLGGYSPWGCKESDTTELLTQQHASFKLNVFDNCDTCVSIFNLSTFLQRRLNSLYNLSVFAY